MPPAVRKLSLTTHIVVSVGWLGAVVAVLALAVVGMASQDPQTVRAAYLSMNLAGWYALVPLALASLISGLIHSLGTVWGLFRHYWVIMKLVINVLASVVLLLYTQTLAYLSGVAKKATWSADELAMLHTPSVLVHAGGALVLLLGAAILSVYKPRGTTRYGRRKQRDEGQGRRKQRQQPAMSQ
jgi:hypothetical protein